MLNIKIRKVACALLLLCIGQNFCYAQSEVAKKVMGELQRVMAQYKSASYLQFNVAYRYADEASPGKYLDSITAEFKLNGKQFWYSVDRTESVGNEDTVLMLFKDDEVIYLSRPSSAAAALSPVALIDSFLIAHPSVKYSYKQTAGEYLLRMDFDSLSPYQSIEYRISATTHLLSGIRCVINSTELYDPLARPLVEGGAAHAIIEISFYNYRWRTFDPSVFEVTRYFKKSGEELIALPPYDSYKIFLGTPNL